MLYSEKLKSFQAAHPCETIAVCGAQCRYILNGENIGRTLVFLNGGMNTLEMWMDYVEGLSGDCRVLLFDYPQELRTNQELVAGMYAFFQKLGIENPVFVGASDSGMVAQIYVQKYPGETGGLVLIYRYLKQIVRISSRRALLLTGFTGCFFTTVVLSFTTESYPFSFFLLVFSLLMLSREYMLTGYIKGRTILFLSFLCGGITITNAAKPTMALFLNKAPFWRKIRTGFKVMLPFVVCVAAVMGFYTLKAKLFNPEGPSPIETTGQLGQYFIHDETFGKQALVDFWGNTIISTPLTQQLVGKEVVLRPSEYLHSWNNAVIMFLLFLVAASALLNLKNKYVQLLLMYLSIDFVIHFIIRYGMNEAILFGGHWMFAVPILLGWLYTRLPVRMYRILDWVIIGFFVLTATINTMEFMRSFLFA